MRLRDKVVLVTGISGTVGDKVALSCLKEGARVKGLVRSEAQLTFCNEIGITPANGDLTDREAIRAALKGVHIVIHAAAYLGDDRELAERSNVHGVKCLVDEALSAGVERFVHISSVSVYGHFDEEVELDETSSLAYGHSEVYSSTKCESERIVQAAQVKGLQCVILRPGVICSEYNSHWGDRLVAKLNAAEAITWIHPDDLTPWVHGDNLAEMCVLASIHPVAVNRIYHAVDGNYREHEFALRIANALNKEINIPEGKPIRMKYRDNKIIEELGYRSVRSFEETMDALEEQARRYLL